MQQKAAEELVDVQGEELFGVAMRAVAIAEADMLAVKGEEPGLEGRHHDRAVITIAPLCCTPAYAQRARRQAA